MNRRPTAFLLAAIGALSLLAPRQSDAAPLTLDQIFQTFNVYSITDINYSNTDIQGVVGTGDDFSFTNFQVGGAGNTGFAVLSGGDVTLQSGSVLAGIEAGGNVSITSTSVSGDVSYGGSFTKNGGNVSGSVTNNGGSLSVDHGQIGATLVSAANNFGGLSATGSVVNSFGNLTFNGGAGLNVFSLTAAQLAAATSFLFNGPGKFLINVAGASVVFPNVGYGFGGGADQQDLLFALAEATTLSLTSGKGSILAPFATATYSSGGLDGSVYVNSLSGSGEIHNFHPGGFDDPGPGPAPVPEPTSLLLIAAGGAAVLLRRRNVA